MVQVMVADDDVHINELIALLLRRAGYQVVTAFDGQETIEKLQTLKIDLLVLDVMMPKIDGYQVVEKIRDKGNLPILMLTAKSQTYDKLKGFNLGIDDYLIKPFEPLELIARVKALVRRAEIKRNNEMRIGDVIIDLDAVTVNGQTIALKEFELLVKFAHYPGKTLSRDQLIEDVWGYDYEGDERTVDVHVKRLRERFRTNHTFSIETVRGLGYRLEVNNDEE